MILPFTFPTISPPAFDLNFFASAAGILLIDLVLSGDNALVIGATASRLPVYDLPLETEHMRQLYNARTDVNKILVVNREIRPNRITMIIVKEELGF